MTSSRCGKPGIRCGRTVGTDRAADARRAHGHRRNVAVRPAETPGVITGGRKLPFGNIYVTWVYVIALGFFGELFNPGSTGPPTLTPPGATRPGYPLYLRNYMSVIRPRLWITLWTTFSGEGERVVLARPERCCTRYRALQSWVWGEASSPPVMRSMRRRLCSKYRNPRAMRRPTTIGNPRRLSPAAPHHRRAHIQL